MFSALKHYDADGTWDLKAYTIKEDVLTTDINRTVIDFSFYLTRRDTFYVITFILPVRLTANISYILSYSPCPVFAIYLYGWSDFVYYIMKSDASNGRNCILCGTIEALSRLED